MSVAECKLNNVFQIDMNFRLDDFFLPRSLTYLHASFSHATYNPPPMLPYTGAYARIHSRENTRLKVRVPQMCPIPCRAYANDMSHELHMAPTCSVSTVAHDLSPNVTPGPPVITSSMRCAMSLPYTCDDDMMPTLEFSGLRPNHQGVLADVVVCTSP